jgi:hypothetical protein
MNINNNNNNNYGAVAKHVKRKCFCCGSYEHMRKQCPVKPIKMELYKSKMFTIDLILSTSGLKQWTPKQVIEYYNSAKFYYEYPNISKMKKYINSCKEDLNRVYYLNDDILMAHHQTVIQNDTAQEKIDNDPRVESPEGTGLRASQAKSIEVSDQNLPITGKPLIKNEAKYDYLSSDLSTTASTVNDVLARIKSAKLPDNFTVKELEGPTNDEKREGEEDQHLDYQMSDFVSFDAYQDYIEYGDLSGLKKSVDTPIAKIMEEVEREQEMDNQREAKIQMVKNVANENRVQINEEQSWKIRNKQGCYKKEMVKALTKKEVSPVDTCFKLGLPALEALQYTADMRFPLTSFMREYDDYTEEEIQGLEFSERCEAYWQRSAYGLADLVLQQSTTMLNEIDQCEKGLNKRYIKSDYIENGQAEYYKDLDVSSPEYYTTLKCS